MIIGIILSGFPKSGAEYAYPLSELIFFASNFSDRRFTDNKVVAAQLIEQQLYSRACSFAFHIELNLTDRTVFNRELNVWIGHGSSPFQVNLDQRVWTRIKVHF
jgi:hypothetical protein